MMALVVVVNYLDECKEIADSSDLPSRALFHAYADIGKWELWRPRKMTAIRDRIRAIFAQRDVNPVRITGSNAIDETLLSLIPEELRALRLQTFATCRRKKCPKVFQFNADIHEMDYLKFPITWHTNVDVQSIVNRLVLPFLFG
jgi:hypothetical protein